MNRVNPLYLGLLLVFIMLFSFYSLNAYKSELKEAKDIYDETSKLANELSSLKDVYSDKKNLENSLKRLLNQSQLKEANIESVFKNNNVVINSNSIDKNALDILIGKIINSTYNIESFEIKKLSDEKASIKMEIKW